MEKKKIKNTGVILLGIFIILLIGISYAWLQLSISGNRINVIKAGTLSLKLDDDTSEGINIANAIPISDEEGLLTKGYDFSLINNGTIPSDYIIYLDDIKLEEGEKRIPDSAIKYSLTKNGEEQVPKLLSDTGINPNRKLDQGKLDPGKTNSYTLKLWIDYKADESIIGAVFAAKIRVEASQEGITGGSGDDNKPEDKYDKVIDIDNGNTQIETEKDPSEYEFISKDSEVADVDENGNIIPKGPGEVTIIIKDKETGETEEKKIQITKTIEVEYIKGIGIEKIKEDGDTSCKLTKKGQTTCKVKLPSIEAEAGYRVLGWSKKEVVEVGEITTKEHEKVEIGEGEKYFAIGKKEQGSNIEVDIDNGNTQIETEKDPSRYEYTSSDTEVAEVDDKGNITPIGPGEATITIKDKETGEIEEKKVHITRTINVQYEKPEGIKTIDEEVPKSCKITTKNQVSCKITLPSVEVNEGYIFLGFSETEEGTTLLNSSEEISLTKDTTYYLIAPTIASITNTVTFHKNSEWIKSIGATTISCVRDECLKVTLPEIEVEEGYELVGWATTEDATEGLAPGEIVKINSDTEYYAISKKVGKTLTATFYKNGAISQTYKENEEALPIKTSSESIGLSCTIADAYNGEKQATSCSVNTPIIEASLNTPEVLGYAKTANEIHETNMIKTDKIEINRDIDYYAITKKTAVEKEIIYIQRGLGVIGIGATRNTCTIAEKYNGEKQSESCILDAPSITVNESDGYEAIGWSVNENEKNEANVIAPGEAITLTEDTVTYYSISKKKSKTLTATFYLNGAGSQDGSDSPTIIKTCTIPEVYNVEKQDKECTIKTPVLEGSHNTPKVVEPAYALGNKNQNTIIGIVNSNTEISISSDIEYSAITTNEEKEYVVTFHLNNGKSQTNRSNENVIGDVTRSCKILVTYNGIAQKETCSITSPNAVGSTNTPKVIGYSRDKDDHTSSWNMNEEKSDISENMDYYLQTTNGIKTYEVSSFEKGEGVESISSTDAISCSIGATYNGIAQDESCTIESEILPTINPKTGYTSVGFSKIKGDTTGVNEIVLTENIEKYYANATANSYLVAYYSEGEEKATTSAKVDESFNLTSAEKLGIEKQGYTFKGWALEANGTVVYTDGQLVNNLRTTSGEVINLYAVWVDETKPVCSFGTAPTIHTQETGEITLTCVDNGSGINNQELTIDNFSVNDSTYGEVTAVSSPNISGNSYEYIIIVKGLSSGLDESTEGAFNITLHSGSISDAANNVNDEVISDNIKINGITYTATFTMQGNIEDTNTIGIIGIGRTTLSCTTIGPSVDCTVEAPAIEMEEGYTAVGWNKDQNATTGIAPEGEIILNSNDNTYYTITYKNGITLTANYNTNGANLSCPNNVDSDLQCTMSDSEIEPVIPDTDSDNKLGKVSTKLYETGCNIDKAYNMMEQEETCSVITPIIEREDFIITGYGEREDSTTANFSGGEEILLTADSESDFILTGKEWFALTSKDINISWEKGDEDTLIGTNTAGHCTIINNATYCGITTPTIEKEGFVILGWYNGEKKVANAEEKIYVNNNITLTAKTRAIMASEVSYDNSKSGSSCTNAQCAIDEINDIIGN